MEESACSTHRMAQMTMIHKPISIDLEKPVSVVLFIIGNISFLGLAGLSDQERVEDPEQEEKFLSSQLNRPPNARVTRGADNARKDVEMSNEEKIPSIY